MKVIKRFLVKSIFPKIKDNFKNTSSKNTFNNLKNTFSNIKKLPNK